MSVLWLETYAEFSCSICILLKMISIIVIKIYVVLDTLLRTGAWKHVYLNTKYFTKPFYESHMKVFACDNVGEAPRT